MSIETLQNIRSIEGLKPREVDPANAPAQKGGQISFAETLGQALGSVDKIQVQADEQASKVAMGGGNLHEMSLALEKADISMRLAVKVRNKLVEAYNEIMRMGV
ncbi:MAG TPA: flagellar hook-basal body complex protein FliE [Polyangia bacterium]|jgi:flagellar hook-basal body complex protein FliE|nr:flagellar hook-basal body complex protein FliE [Polyangia bacterium]